MKSAAELAQEMVPEITYYWGDLLRNQGRLTLIGAPKITKSFFVLQMGLHIATGTPFLRMKTEPSVVLHVNFEISGEKLQERLGDVCNELLIPHPADLMLASPGWLALETPEGKGELENLIEQVKAARGRLDVLILDPRRQSMGGGRMVAVIARLCRLAGTVG